MSCHHPAGKRVGLTLIELVVASALSVILVAAISGTLRSMRTQKKAVLDGVSVNNHWQELLVDSIQQDLANARDMVTRPGELRLRGFCGHDPISKESTHRLAEVVYSIRQIGNQDCLVRDEHSLDKHAANGVVSEIVGIGITEVLILGCENDENQEATDWINALRPKRVMKTKQEQVKTNEWVPVPKTFRFLLMGSDRQAIAQKLVVL